MIRGAVTLKLALVFAMLLSDAQQQFNQDKQSELGHWKDNDRMGNQSINSKLNGDNWMENSFQEENFDILGKWMRNEIKKRVKREFESDGELNNKKEEHLRYFIMKELELRDVIRAKDKQNSLCKRDKRQSRVMLNSSYINDLEDSFPREPVDDSISVTLKGQDKNGPVVGEESGSIDEDNESRRKKRLSEASKKDFFTIYEEGDPEEEARELRELEELEKLEAKRFVDGKASARLNPGLGIVVERVTAEEFPANLPAKINRLLKDHFHRYSENDSLRRDRRNKKRKKAKKKKKKRKWRPQKILIKKKQWKDKFKASNFPGETNQVVGDVNVESKMDKRNSDVYSEMELAKRDTEGLSGLSENRKLTQDKRATGATRTKRRSETKLEGKTLQKSKRKIQLDKKNLKDNKRKDVSKANKQVQEIKKLSDKLLAKNNLRDSKINRKGSKKSNLSKKNQVKVNKKETRSKRRQSKRSKEDEGDGPRHSARKWDRWTDWSACSVTCGKGRQIRWRHCLRDCKVADTEMEEKACQMPACQFKFLGIF